MAHTAHRAAFARKREGIAGRIAGGNHLVAQNAEPEPLTQEDFALARGFAGEDADYCLQRAVDERAEGRS